MTGSTAGSAANPTNRVTPANPAYPAPVPSLRPTSAQAVPQFPAEPEEDSLPQLFLLRSRPGATLPRNDSKPPRSRIGALERALFAVTMRRSTGRRMSRPGKR